MDKRKNVASCCSKRLEDCGQNLNVGSKENLKKIKEARNRCEESGKHCISGKRRGITGEDLAQGIRSGSVEFMSIDDKSDQMSSRHIRDSTSSPGKVLGQSDSTSSPGKVLGQSDSTSSPTKVFGQSDSTSRPGKVLYQSDVTSSPKKVWGKPDRRSSKSLSHLYMPSSSTMALKSGLMGTLNAASGQLQNQNKQIVRLSNKDPLKNSTEKVLGKPAFREPGGNNSNCETFSSLERATANKLQDVHVMSRKILAGNSKNGQDRVHVVVSPSIQKKKAKTVPHSDTQSLPDKTHTNILVGSSRRKQFPPKPHLRPYSSRTTSLREKQDELMGDLKAMKPAPGNITYSANTTTCTTSEFPMTAEKYEMPQPIIDLFVPVLKFSKFFNVEQKICTPSHDQLWHSSPVSDSSTFWNNKSTSSIPQVDVPSHGNSAVTNILSEEYSCKKSVCKLVNEVSNTSLVEKPQNELDMKSLQLTSLKSKDEKTCPHVDNGAAAHDLCQSKKEDQQESDVAGSQRVDLVGNILEKAKLNFESLALLNTQAGEDFSEGSPLMEAVEHYLPYTNFLLSEQEGEENNLYSEKLERALRESENLLEELSLLTVDNTRSSPSQFMDNTCWRS